MAQANAMARVGQRVGLLLALVLAVVTACVLWSEADLPGGRPGDALTAAHGVDAVPVGVSGRPAATPSVVRVSSPAEAMPFGVVPNDVARLALARWELLPSSGPVVVYAQRRPAEGDRAPPSLR